MHTRRRGAPPAPRGRPDCVAGAGGSPRRWWPPCPAVGARRAARRVDGSARGCRRRGRAAPAALHPLGGVERPDGQAPSRRGRSSGLRRRVPARPARAPRRRPPGVGPADQAHERVVGRGEVTAGAGGERRTDDRSHTLGHRCAVDRVQQLVDQRRLAQHQAADQIRSVERQLQDDRRARAVPDHRGRGPPSSSSSAAQCLRVIGTPGRPRVLHRRCSRRGPSARRASRPAPVRWPAG